jgi:hypothetical protein
MLNQDRGDSSFLKKLLHRVQDRADISIIVFLHVAPLKPTSRLKAAGSCDVG